MRGVASYFKKHQWGNTELNDLLVELERESGRELSSWSKLWLETAGVNTLKPVFELDASGNYSSFAVLQSAIEEHPTIRPHRMGIGMFNLVGGKLERSEYFELDIAGERTEISELVGKRQPDLLLLNDNDLAYAKIRMDERSRKVALENLSDISDSLARTLVWTAAWDATRDGEAPASEFIDLVLGHIAPETESTTILTLLRQLVTTGTLYVAPAKREATLEKIASGLIKLAEQAEPGSDSQLQFTKYVPQFARTAAQLDWMETLLTGKQSLKGLTVDQDVRWELLIGLVIGGRYAATEIDAELARDNTANGQKFAAAARAAIPTPAGKAEAWRLLTETEDYSNTLVNAASLAFGRVNDVSLLEPYMDKYLTNAERLWDERSYHIAAYLLNNLYPIQLANQQLADKTKVLIDSPAFVAKPALRRILVEGLAGLERGLKAQRVDS